MFVLSAGKDGNNTGEARAGKWSLEVSSVCLFVYRHFLLCCENKPRHEENDVIISFYSKQSPWSKIIGMYSAYSTILR